MMFLALRVTGLIDPVSTDRLTARPVALSLAAR
jgi:hypothetical protein